MNIEEKSASKTIIETKNGSGLKDIYDLKEEKVKKNKRRKLFRRKQKEFKIIGTTSF